MEIKGEFTIQRANAKKLDAATWEAAKEIDALTFSTDWLDGPAGPREAQIYSIIERRVGIALMGKRGWMKAWRESSGPQVGKKGKPF